MPELLISLIHPADITSYAHGFMVACFMCAGFVLVLHWADMIDAGRILPPAPEVPKSEPTIEEAMADIKREVEAAGQQQRIIFTPISLTTLSANLSPSHRDAKGRFLKRGK